MNREAHYILNFHEKTQSLKRVKRKGWFRAGVKKPESVADHSYACAMLSMIAGDLYGLDTDRLIRMALLHDLPESVMGDLTPREKRKLGTKIALLEKRSAKATLAPLPSKTKRKYLSLMDDYREQCSRESRVLKDLDKIEMSIQALAYVKEGYSIRRMAEFLSSTEKELRTDMAKNLFEALTSGKRI